MTVSILLAFFHHSLLGLKAAVMGFSGVYLWYALVRILFAIGVHPVTKIGRIHFSHLFHSVFCFSFSPFALTHAPEYSLRIIHEKFSQHIVSSSSRSGCLISMLNSFFFFFGVAKAQSIRVLHE